MAQNIRIKGLKRLTRRMDNMARDVRPKLEDASEEAILHVHEQVPEYPQPSRDPQPFKSARQRRHFFWLLSTGQIDVPYRRGGTLGRTVTTFKGRGEVHALSRVEALGAKIRGIVGTKLSYARLVIDEEEQAEYHKGTWWTLQEVVEDSLDGIKKIYQRAVDELVKGR